MGLLSGTETGSGSTAEVCDSGVKGGVKAGLIRFGGGGDPDRLCGADDVREYSETDLAGRGWGAWTGES